MDRRRWVIALAVGAVVVGATLAVAVNVATSPGTASWARGGAWLVTVAAAVVGVGLAMWHGEWLRRDARRDAEKGLAHVRETLVEDAVTADRSDPARLGLYLRQVGGIVGPDPDDPAPAWPLPGPPATVTDLEEWFTRLTGSLLVVGEPGAGKTAVLAALARRMGELAREDPRRPVPMLLSLASWGVGGRTLQSWVAEELRRRYAVPPHATREILRPGRSGLLLDGLDELPVRDRADCLRAVNEFMNRLPSMQIAVASRREEYRELDVRLTYFNAAVEVAAHAQAVTATRGTGLGDSTGLRRGTTPPWPGQPDEEHAKRPPLSRYRLDDGPTEEFAPVVVTPEDDADEEKPSTGEFPRLHPAGQEHEEAERPSARPAPAEPGPVTSGARQAVLEQRVLSVLDDQVSQDELQIASAARITPGETARTLRRLQERGLVTHALRRATGVRLEQRYVKR